jgi:hypothetical protein
MQDYPQVLVDTWAVHEALRRLGFASEDIFVHVAGNGEAPTSGPWLFVVLKTQGKEFSIDIGPLGKLSPEEALRTWHVFCEKWNTREFLDSEAQRMYEARFLKRTSAAGLATGLLSKGFVFPRYVN